MFTKIQYNFLPIALFNNWATTLLSTPPDKAHITLLFPTCFLTSFINLIFWSLEDQFLLILQIRNIKLLIINFPLIVWVTSGWNWTPYIFLILFSTIANLEFWLEAITIKFFGNFETWSAWLIHTFIFLTFFKKSFYQKTFFSLENIR